MSFTFLDLLFEIIFRDLFTVITELHKLRHGYVFSCHCVVIYILCDGFGGLSRCFYEWTSDLLLSGGDQVATLDFYQAIYSTVLICCIKRISSSPPVLFSNASIPCAIQSGMSSWSAVGNRRNCSSPFVHASFPASSHLK